MLKAEEQMELMVLKKHGESIRGLSRLTGRSRNTVRRYLRSGADATCNSKNVGGFGKKIDHALERIAAIEKHLGINKKIAA